MKEEEFTKAALASEKAMPKRPRKTEPWVVVRMTGARTCECDLSFEAYETLSKFAGKRARKVSWAIAQALYMFVDAIDNGEDLTS